MASGKHNVRSDRSVNWPLIAASLVVGVGVQIFEVVRLGSPGEAVVYGRPDRTPLGYVTDLIIIVAALMVAAALPKMSSPEPMSAKQRRTVAISMIFLVVVIVLWTTFNGVYEGLADEDRLIEYAQFLLILFCAGLAQRVALNFRSARERGSFYAAQAVAVGFLVLGGEEISWGQRIFGFESTGAFANVNEQAETNLHNFLTPPLDAAYYLVTALFLIVLPIVWHHAGLKEFVGDRIAWAHPFVAPSWLALVLAPSLALSYVTWDLIPVMVMVPLGIALIAKYWLMSDGPTTDRPQVAALLALVMGQTIVGLTLTERVWPNALSEITEYRETAIAIALVIYLVTLSQQTAELRKVDGQ